MIKKLLVLVLIAFATMASLCAMEETFTIYLVSVVKAQQPQFILRNTETGAIGQSVTYSTTEIARSNVRTSFEILQSNDSNYRGTIHFAISASELVSYSNGKEYRTDGVRINLNGQKDQSSNAFAFAYTQNIKAGEVIASFDVIWETNPNLVSANYQSLVTLTYSAD